MYEFQFKIAWHHAPFNISYYPPVGKRLEIFGRFVQVNKDLHHIPFKVWNNFIFLKQYRFPRTVHHQMCLPLKEQRCRPLQKCKSVPSNWAFSSTVIVPWRNATIVVSYWRWKEEMVNGTYHQPQMTLSLSQPRGGPIGKTASKNVVNCQTCISIAEMNACGPCNQPFFLFMVVIPSSLRPHLLPAHC